MKILHVIPSFPPAYAFGGGPRIAFLQAKELVKRGHEVTVYTTDAKDHYSRIFNKRVKWIEKDVKGIRVVYFGNLSMFIVRKFSLFITPTLKTFAKYQIKEFDIIHLHGLRSYQNIIIAQLARKYGIPYVIQAHGTIPAIGAWKTIKKLYDITFGCKILNNASRAIALTSEEAREYESRGVPPDKIAIIPNGIDLSNYAVLPPKDIFKEKIGIPKDKKIILYIGGIHWVKGIDILIKAYSYFKNKLGYREAVLVLVGPDHGYLNKAKVLARSSGVSDSIIFTGPMYGKDKLSAYVDADVFVLPSRHEGFPMVLLEAWACGKPVIASRTGGLRELISDGETGILFEPENHKELAEKILYLLNDPAKAEEIGRKAKLLVERKYSINKIVEQIERVYHDVISSKDYG